jgi:hypothetical protein
MENRDRDKMSQRSGLTQAGEVNRQASEPSKQSGSATSFGQKIGRSEYPLNEPSKSGVGSGGMKGGSSSGQQESGWKSENGSSKLKDTQSTKDDIALGEEVMGRGSQGGSRR